MGFVTTLLTNPSLYYWIVERIIDEVKNLSKRLKKLGSIRPLNRVAKTQLKGTVIDRDHSTKTRKTSRTSKRA